MPGRKLNRRERRMLEAKGFDIPEDGTIPEGVSMEAEKKNSPVPMPPRQPDVVQAEYEKACAALGEKRYQVALLEAQIGQLIQTVDRLVGEAKRAAKVHEEAQQPEAQAADPAFEKMKQEILAQAQANVEKAEEKVNDEAVQQS